MALDSQTAMPPAATGSGGDGDAHDLPRHRAGLEAMIAVLDARVQRLEPHRALAQLRAREVEGRPMEAATRQALVRYLEAELEAHRDYRALRHLRLAAAELAGESHPAALQPPVYQPPAQQPASEARPALAEAEAGVFAVLAKLRTAAPDARGAAAGAPTALPPPATSQLAAAPPAARSSSPTMVGPMAEAAPMRTTLAPALAGSRQAAPAAAPVMAPAPLSVREPVPADPEASLDAADETTEIRFVARPANPLTDAAPRLIAQPAALPTLAATDLEEASVEIRRPDISPAQAAQPSQSDFEQAGWEPAEGGPGKTGASAMLGRLSRALRLDRG